MEELGLWKERIEQCVKAYLTLFENLEIRIPEEGYLAGFHRPIFQKEIWQTLSEADNMHYPMGDACLRHGVAGVLEMTEGRQKQDTDLTDVYRRGVHRVYLGVQAYIRKHAEKAEKLAAETDEAEERNRLLEIVRTCRKLAEGKPETFREGLQLFWFLYLLRSGFGGGCIGRLDQKLYPFVEAQIRKGSWDAQSALEDILQLYRRLNEMITGDTLRNLMLSGQNAAGEDETNELTYLFLEAYTRTQDAEPHLNVRIHPGTPQKLKDICVRLLEEGKGQPTLYFDRHIIPAMERAGIAHEDACRYANDGCTETVIDGRSGIVFWQHEMVKTVELTLFSGEENPFIYPVEMTKNRRNSPVFVPHTGLRTGFRSGELSGMHNFEDFLSAYFRQQEYQVGEWIRQIDRKIGADERNTLTSPLIGGTMEACLRTGKDPLRGGGFSVPNYQLLSGTVTTAADCLRAVELCVFEKGFCTLLQLRDALAVNFEGEEVLRQRLLHAPKYGNGESRVDELAAMIAQRFLDQVNAYRSQSGKRIWPGLYNIDFKIMANTTGATPDGRKFRDAIGEHCSPTPGAAEKGPTAILESASRLPMDQGYASSPLHLTLDKNGFVMGADRKGVIRQLVKTAERYGVPVLNLSMYDRRELMDAREHPERHKDLIVRVWGFNARFVELDDELQEHIIRRIS